MNLEKMLQTQKQLDDRIIKAKGLEGQDLFPNTVLALQVELAEMANEGRWFKHWSDDQNSRIKNDCIFCNGNGFISYGTGAVTSREEEPCKECDGIGYSKPLLEEYADSVHFFLSIAIQKDWQDALWVYEEQLDPDEFSDDLTSWYLEMTYFINKSYFENYSKVENEKFKNKFGFPKNQYWFRMAWILFLNIGINGFEFTLEQVEEAYFTKNAVNHARQENGY
jgi:dimeric dUTPase (all-alpha-NTP-PPase superfamily)